MQRRLLRPQRRLVRGLRLRHVQEHQRLAGVHELSRELWRRRQRAHRLSVRHGLLRPRRRGLQRMRRRHLQKRRRLNSVPGVPSVVVPGRECSFGVHTLSRQRGLARR